ncbi:DUF4303 domain-containing protein [Cronobacter dublinensis]|nr:DUF4303 domain-containing protein [Cronobacter dublinensis]
MGKLWDSFEKNLESAVRNDYLKLVKHLKEEVYSVALVTDSYAKSLFLALNTTEALAEAKLKYIKNVGPEDDCYIEILKWTPSEWAYSNDDLDNSEIKNISHQLAHIEDCSDEFQAKFYQSLTDVLTVLRKSGLFPENDFTLFISVTDDDRSEAVENYSAQLLNPKDTFMKFQERYSEHTE